MFASVLGLIAIYRPLRRLNIFPISSSSLMFTNVNSIFFIVCTLISYFVLIKLGSARELIFSGAVLAGYLGLYLLAVINKNQLSINTFAIKSKFVFFLVAFSLMAPILTAKFINSESYVDESLKNYVIEHNRKIDSSQKDFFDIKLTEIEMTNVNSNINYLNVVGNGLNGAYYELHSLGQNSFIRFYLHRKDLTPLCLLGDYLSYKDNIDFGGCLVKLASASEGNIKSIVSILNSVPIENKNIKKIIYSELNSIFIDNNYIVKSDDVEDLGVLIFVKGAYFHHYNSIAHTINGAKPLSTYFANQYGFGPLFISSTIAKILKIPIFDGIYLSIILVNILVFFLLLFGLSRGERSNELWLGFAMSILITYFISNVLAPFLYYVRYFPTVILGLLFYKATVNDISIKKNTKYTVLLIICMCLISFYNFEYAVITFLAVLIAGIVTSEMFYISLGLIFILLSIVPKLVQFTFGIAGQNSVNYLNYISGVGFGSSWGLIVYLFMISVSVVYYILIKEFKSTEVKKELIVLAFITALLLTKIIWMGSANHIGPIFLMLAFLVAGIKHSIKESPNLNSHLNVLNVYSSITILIFIIGLLSWPHFFQNTKFSNIKYVHNNISNIFKIPSGLSEKLQEFKSIYKQGDLVISPIDNALSLSLGKQLTSNFPDLSTNLNSLVDVILVSNAYTKNHVDRVIVDQNVVEIKERQFSYYQAGKNTTKLRSLYIDHFVNVSRMELIYKNLLSSGFYVCDKNHGFVALCRDSNRNFNDD
ncbi:MAG: hypothetical protein A3I83_05575 [Methylotenera sp. RIFCSPLOWO2_02_FULL_45_14]|nr:MAG: hypothetical protein A3I83_05575 [Methylotenera sp. RIFCSPLOWO2_02_FULL_45_14]